MNITTSRLTITGLTLSHSEFIFELLNTPEWKQFIGERYIKTLIDAEHYIHKINGNPNVEYWTVSLLEEHTPIGVITYIKRDYLALPDFGFAFLAQYGKKGYAFEAAHAVLKQLFEIKKINELLAITNPDNQNSIALLNKLNFQFEKEILVNGEHLLMYRIDKSLLFKE